MQGQLEFEDIQAFIFTGYGKLRLARYVFFQIREPGKARRWLGELADGVKTGAQFLEEKQPPGQAWQPAKVDGELATAVHVAFTAQGLRRLGLTDESLTT